LESPCDTVFINYLSSSSGVSFDPCNRARIPGLTPLYDMVYANVSAVNAAGGTVPEYGVVIDGLREPSDGAEDHGDRVVATANIATLPQLFDYIEVGLLKPETVRAFQGLGSATTYGGRPIVNISQANLFSISGFSDINLISPEDVRDANALVVTAAGNYGPSSSEARAIINLGSRIELRTTPDEPAHNPDALQQIYRMTGSILVVAGLHNNRGLPLTDANGFHKEYTAGDPVIHPSSNRCGRAMNFCVAAPYTIFREVGGRTFQGGIPVYNGLTGIHGTSFSAPLVTGTLVNLRYAWPHLTNRQLVRLACVTAEDLGARGIDAIYGCGQFSVSAIWQPTGELVSDPVAQFSLPVASGSMSVSGASFSEPVTVTGYENNEFRRDYEVAVAASDTGTSVRIDPTVSWNSLNSILRFRQNGAASLPLADGRGSAAHVFKDTFLFLKGAENSFGALGLSHGSGLSIAFERETGSFFGSAGSGSYEFGDTNKIVASFDREFQIGKFYNAGLKLAAAYGKMEPDISLVSSASGGAQTAQLSIGRKKNNFETLLEMSYSTGLKGEISVQNTNYKLKPISEKAIMLKMRLAI